MPKGRPRFARHGSFVSTHTPAKTRNWEEFVKYQSLSHRPNLVNPVGVPECSVGMELEFLLPRPVSLPKKYQRHRKKPDIENLAKSVLDALEGIYYKNDSQIDELKITKRYASGDQGPGVIVALEYREEL